MDYIMNESTLRYLRKQRKDLSEEEIKIKAKPIWDKYVAANKQRLEKEAKQNKEAFDKSVDLEFMNLLMDDINK